MRVSDSEWAREFLQQILSRCVLVGVNNPRNVGTGSALCWNDQSGFPLDWNGPINRPFDPFPNEAKARPIIELLEAVVHRYPQRIALAGPDASITYAEIWRALAGWAEQITGATAPGDLVGILAPVSTAIPNSAI